MTYLLLQTFLLLLSAYFAGALFGCLAKRALMTRSPDMAAVAARTSPANYVESEENIPLIRPREIDPVQPRIEVFPRPARKEFAVNDKLDISRFERALIGPDPNEGMPRKMIVQIRPAVLKPVTGPAQPFKKPEPKVEAPKVAEPAKPIAAKADAPKIEPAKPDTAKAELAKPAAATPAAPVQSAPVKPEPSKAEAAAAQAAANIAAAQKSAPTLATTPATPAAQAPEKSKAEPSKDTGASSSGASPMMAGIAGASAAAAAAVAAAKAAAAAVVPRAAPSSPQQQKPVVDLKPTEPAKPAAPPSATVPPSGPATPAATLSATQSTTSATPSLIPAPAAKPQPVSPHAAVVKPDVTETLAKAATPQPSKEPESPRAPAGQDVGHAYAATPGDDLQRIRAIDAETMRRLADISINSFEQIAHWTPADVNRVNQTLGLAGRVDREQWIEQAQILAKGGETYYSRNRATASKSPAAPEAVPAAQPGPTPAPTQPQPFQPKPAQAAPVQPAAAQPAPALQTSVPSVSKPKDVSPAAPAPAPPAAQTPAAQSPISQTPIAQAPAAPQIETAKPSSAAPTAAATPAQTAAPTAAASPAAPQQASPSTAAGSALQGKSVAEMASAAAAAIAAASASVTRGIRPIEPISPLTRANPNIVMPAKLSDALKDNESKAQVSPATAQTAAPQAKAGTKPDDLKRIRGIGVLIEKRLNALGITTYSEIANWNSADIDRISQTLEFKGRIERESWVEHARILASGGQTEFSRRVDRGDVESSRDDS